MYGLYVVAFQFQAFCPYSFLRIVLMARRRKFSVEKVYLPKEYVVERAWDMAKAERDYAFRCMECCLLENDCLHGRAIKDARKCVRRITPADPDVEWLSKPRWRRFLFWYTRKRQRARNSDGSDVDTDESDASVLSGLYESESEHELECRILKRPRAV
jgi:hypothetical protein